MNIVEATNVAVDLRQWIRPLSWRGLGRYLKFVGPELPGCFWHMGPLKMRIAVHELLPGEILEEWEVVSEATIDQERDARIERLNEVTRSPS